ncbi:hypothetical protein EDB84DRAFT_1563229 [Lactarius hengduanensis]|nr:hypothetical protein EDB84DRAFT_1563229 [Lactarius hengduanensis]
MAPNRTKPNFPNTTKDARGRAPASRAALFARRQGCTRKGGAQGKEGRTRACHPPYPLSASPPPAQKGGARGRVVWAPTSRLPPSPPPVPLSAPPIRTEGMHMRAPVTTLSLSSRPLPSHSRRGTPPPPFPVRAEGVTPPPSPSPVPPFPPWRKGAHKGTPPLSPLPPLDCHAHDGTLPPAPPFPVCAEEGRTRGAPLSPPPPAPPLTAPPPPHPSAFTRQRGGTRGYSRKGVHAGTPLRMRGKSAREVTQPPAPPIPVALGPPFPLDLTAPYMQEGGTRGHVTPRPFPSPFVRKGGVRHRPALTHRPRLPSLSSLRHVRGQAAPSRGAPFAREGVHEAKPTSPPYVSRSGASVVSVHPRSPRHSTT